MTLAKVRAFTSDPQGGNPAGVMVLADVFAIDSLTLQQWATQSAEPVTAFVSATTTGYQIRWFTPTQEINLCGHGTLAAAALLFDLHPELPRLQFFSRFGDIAVAKTAAGLSMVLPAFALQPQAVAELPLAITQQQAVAAAVGRDLILELSSAQQVLDYQADFSAIRQLPWHALLITALLDEQPAAGYCLRYFAPGIGIDEDPATGSAHCSLLPYWQAQYPKQQQWQAQQFSPQGGSFSLRSIDARVELTSQAIVLHPLGQVPNQS